MLTEICHTRSLSRGRVGSKPQRFSYSCQEHIAMQTATPEMASTQHLIEVLLAWYKRWLSPLFGNSCRFTPTCSEYGAQAIAEHGWAKGSGMAVWRLLRCHPFGGSGYDPVPRCAHSEQLRS